MGNHSMLRLGLGLLLFACSGCALNKPAQHLATQAVAFNLTVENAQNEMLLLNVIRAKERYPMYLTAISSLSGNVNSTVTGSLGGSFSQMDNHSGSTEVTTGGSSDGTSKLTSMMSKAITRGLTPSVGGTLARNPSFTLGVLDSEEFTRGFLTPIEPKTFAYFWDQGWPRELLLYLFVQRAEIGSEVYLNYPGDWQEYVKFARWVEHFLETQPTVESKEKPIPIGPLLDSTKIEGLGDLVKASKDGLRVQWCTNELESSDGKAQLCDGSPQTEGERSGWQLERVRVEYHLKPTLVPCQGSADKCHKEEGATAEQETMLGPPTPDSAGGEEQDRLVLRSPEAVLYYLGELTRFANQTTDLWIPLVCIQGEFQPLFLAVPRSKQCEAPLVEAHSPWGEYVVAQTRQDRQHLAWESECREVRASCDIAHDDGPRGESDYLEWKTGGQKPCELCERAHKADAAGCQCRPGALIREDGKLESCDSGRSMQALRLLSQLISLQKSADELPSPALVRVIGN